MRSAAPATQLRGWSVSVGNINGPKRPKYLGISVKASDMLRICGLGLLLASCAGSRGGPVPYADAGLAAPDLPIAVEAARAYRAGVGDEISVSVFGSPEFSGNFTVDERGEMQMPLVGAIPVLNLSAQEISQVVVARLGQTYLRNPDAVVNFHARTSNRVTVDGAVKTPGNYAFTGPLTLMRVVAMGGGLNENANARRVVVFRRINGVDNAAAFDLAMIRRAEMPDPEIYANDIIYVDGSATRQLFRDLLQTIPLIAIFQPFNRR